MHLHSMDRIASIQILMCLKGDLAASITSVPIANLFHVAFTRDASYVSWPLCEVSSATNANIADDIDIGIG